MKRILTPLALLALCSVTQVQAEPYLAVKTGFKCSTCHVNPTGGGKRNKFGNIYGQTQFVTKHEPGKGEKSLSQMLRDGELNDILAIGTDVRINANYTSTPNQDDSFEFELQDAQAYGELRLLPNQLTLYVDEQFAPSGASNREAYGLYRSEDQSLYVKVGKMFLPFGWRLEDDNAFIRQVTGINMNAPDTGVEGGIEKGSWVINMAITNGSSGGAETNTGKQYSLRGEFVRGIWRLGASYNYNDGEDDADRAMQNVFFGLRTGPVAWLGEYDLIQDDSLAGLTDTKHTATGLLEANITPAQGHNLKLTYEHLDPDTDIDEDERNRYSLVYELTPFRFSQLRGGLRINEGIPQNDQQNADEFFVQQHFYF